MMTMMTTTMTMTMTVMTAVVAVSGVKPLAASLIQGVGPLVGQTRRLPAWTAILGEVALPEIVCPVESTVGRLTGETPTPVKPLRKQLRKLQQRHK